MNSHQGRAGPWCVACLAGTVVGFRFLFYGRWADGKREVPKSLRWRHAETLTESRGFRAFGARQGSLLLLSA